MVKCRYLNVECFFFFLKKKLSKVCFSTVMTDREPCKDGEKEELGVAGEWGTKENLSCCLFALSSFCFKKSCYSLIPDDLMTTVTCVCALMCVCPMKDKGS